MTLVTVCTTLFVTQMLYILPSQCIYDFHVILTINMIISLNNINCLVLVMEMYCVLLYIRSELLYVITVFTAHAMTQVVVTSL